MYRMEADSFDDYSKKDNVSFRVYKPFEEEKERRIEIIDESYGNETSSF
jgi:hypothetical protein